MDVNEEVDDDTNDDADEMVDFDDWGVPPAVAANAAAPALAAPSVAAADASTLALTVEDMILVLIVSRG